MSCCFPLLVIPSRGLQRLCEGKEQQQHRMGCRRSDSSSLFSFFFSPLLVENAVLPRRRDFLTGFLDKNRLALLHHTKDEHSHLPFIDGGRTFMKTVHLYYIYMCVYGLILFLPVPLLTSSLASSIIIPALRTPRKHTHTYTHIERESKSVCVSSERKEK